MAGGQQVAKDRAASLRRIAIVLNSLPAPVATRLLGSIDPASKQQLRQMMVNLSDVDPMEQRRALQQFAGSLQQPGTSAGTATPPVDEITFSRTASLSGQPVAAGQVPASGASTSAASEPSRLAFIADVEDDLLVDLLSREHPQTVALVLASIQPAHAARLLPRLPDSLRLDAISRIGRLSEIPADALEEIAVQLQERIERQLNKQSSSGQHVLQAILAQIPSSRSAADSQQASAESRFAGEDERRQSDQSTGPSAHSNSGPYHGNRSADRFSGHAATIPVSSSASHADHAAGSGEADSLMLSDSVHERLVSIKPVDLCRALGLVDTRQALLALCGLPAEVANAAIAVLPRAQAKQVRRQLGNLASLQLRDIDAAKEAVAKASFQNASSASARAVAA